MPTNDTRGTALMRYAQLWLPLAAALDLQLDRLEDLHATLEAHEKEDVLEMTWPKQKWNYSDAASQIDAFLAPRADWRVVDEPWGRDTILRLARPAGPLAELRDAFAKEWRVRQWAAGICEEGFIQVAAPTVLGPNAHQWADSLTTAWARGLGVVPRSLMGWAYGPRDGSSGRLCGGGRSQDPFAPGNRWDCLFLPLTVCDEELRHWDNEPRPFGFARKQARPCSPRHNLPCNSGTMKVKRQSAGTDLRKVAGDDHLSLIRAMAMAAMLRPSRYLRRRQAVLRQSHPFPLPNTTCALLQVRHHARVETSGGSKFASASFMVDLEDGLRDLGPLVGIDGRTLKETPVLLLTDDGDMVGDASLLNPEIGKVVPLPASTGMTSSADQFFGSRSGPHQNQIHTDGATELARILLSLDVAARCASAFVGDCTSNFARFVVTYMTGVSLKTPWSFSPGRNCFSDMKTDAKLNRRCERPCRISPEVCKEFGEPPRTCAPPPPNLTRPIFTGDAGGRFKRLAAEKGMERRPTDYRHT